MTSIQTVARGRQRVIVRDANITSVKRLDEYITRSELQDWIEHATGKRYGHKTVLYWIGHGWIPAVRAGEGPKAAWLFRRDHARHFVAHLRSLASGEVIGLTKAAAYLGDKLGRPGPVSHNTLRAWIYRGVIWPVDPAAPSVKFTHGELDEFAAWFERVKVRRYGQWTLPNNAARPRWFDDSGAPVEVE